MRLLGAGDIRGIAGRLGVRPTKKLGQNFVVEPGTVRQIAALAKVRPADVVLEVGPGLGSLTLALLEAVAEAAGPVRASETRGTALNFVAGQTGGVPAAGQDSGAGVAGGGADGAASERSGADVPGGARVLPVGPGPARPRLVAVEIDPVLAGELPRTLAERAPDVADRVTVLTADALALGEKDLGAPRPTVVAANLPYNVAVPVVLHLLAALPSLRRGVVMVQAEVADRMCAGPGSRVYGVPSVKLAWYADVRPAGTVPRTVFWPVPNVDSKLVTFTRRDPPAAASREQVFAVIDAAFSQRRKTLRAALAAWAGSPVKAEEALRAAGIDPGARGESLSVAHFARIAQHRQQL
ncbi:MAG TPA: rRNA adenine dimethyltransferase family protein [Trebonia sp.]|nr:rRNA adenine dimethyltransferase family protein [Trebonia sp.]